MPTFLRFDLKYTFICVYWWTRQRIHNTLIVVDRYLRFVGGKTIPDLAEPRLESFYPPFVAGIDLPHQGVMDSYNLHNGSFLYSKPERMKVPRWNCAHLQDTLDICGLSYCDPQKTFQISGISVASTMKKYHEENSLSTKKSYPSSAPHRSLIIVLFIWLVQQLW